MRKNFVFFVLIPLIILGIVLYLFLNSWIESGLEYIGEQIVGAKVEIDNFKITVSPLGGEFSRLQVTDPNDGWKNLFETGKAKFAVDLGQLLRGKFIIETMEVNNLILGTKRTSDGSLPKKEKQAEPQDMYRSTGQEAPEPPVTAMVVAEQQKRSGVTFDIDELKRQLNYDSLLNPCTLYTLRYIDTLKHQVAAVDTQWKTTVAELERSKKRITELETTIKSIDVGGIKDIQTATETLTKVRTALSEAQELRKTVENQRQSITNTIQDMNRSITRIDDVLREDYQRALQAAKLPDLSFSGLSEMIFGKEMIDEALTYLQYAEKARAVIKNSSDKPAMEKPKRFKGQTIHFPVERAYPKLWIKKIHISGGTDQKQNPNYFYAKGEVRNITNDQRITGVPLTVDLLATRGGIVTLTMNFLFDRTKNLPYDRYSVQLSGVPIATMSLGSSSFLPAKITNAKMDAGITVEIPYRGFDGRATIQMYNMAIVFEREPKTVVERIVCDVLTPINKFNTLIRMWKVEDQFKMAFETDLDNQLLARTKQVLGAELARLQNEIKNRVDQEINAKRKELEKLYTEKRETIQARLREYESIVTEKVASIENTKKELEQRIESEKNKKTDEVKRKAGETIKKFLR